MTAFFNLGSIVLGLGAWALACFAIKSKTAFSAYRRSIGSLSVCALSLLFQLFELAHRASIGDFSAIADTIRSSIFAACILLIITVALNVIAVTAGMLQGK